jgi:hypothetical protein
MKYINKITFTKLSESFSIGPLQFTLLATIVGGEDNEIFDIEFEDIDDITFNGVEIDGYKNWSKFKEVNLEFGLDYNKMVEDKFDETFTKEKVEEFLKGIK